MIDTGLCVRSPEKNSKRNIGGEGRGSQGTNTTAIEFPRANNRTVQVLIRSSFQLLPVGITNWRATGPGSEAG